MCVCAKHPYHIPNYTCINILFFTPICFIVIYHFMCCVYYLDPPSFSGDRRIGRLWSSVETLLGKYPVREGRLAKITPLLFHTHPPKRDTFTSECEGPAHHASSGEVSAGPRSLRALARSAEAFPVTTHLQHI